MTPTLKERASKWAVKEYPLVIHEPEVKAALERAWLAGFRAGKKEGYNTGLKEGIINHELYNEPSSDSRKEKVTK